jgi:hypothetical protein
MLSTTSVPVVFTKYMEAKETLFALVIEQGQQEDSIPSNQTTLAAFQQ